MSRIGILNFAGHLNHGANLTAYALQRTFSQMGHEVQNLHLHSNSTLYKWDLFTKFADENIAISSACAAGVCNMQKFNKDFDVFVVGSDQVWREADGPDSDWQWKTPHYACYHLAFAQPGKRRIAVAASFGNEQYDAPKHIRESLARELLRFAAISVREESAVENVKLVSGVAATHLVDPVFYITPGEWEACCSSSEPITEGKCLISYNSFYHNECIKKIAQSLQSEYELYDLSSGDTRSWLTSIRNSDFVITDSFHVLCFCLIFETPFVCLAPSGQGVARFTSLQKLAGFSECRVINADCVENLPEEIRKIMDMPMDWSAVRSRLAQCRETALKWLENALKCPIPEWTGDAYHRASRAEQAAELQNNAAAHTCAIVRRNRRIVSFLLAISPIGRSILKRKKSFYDGVLNRLAW